MKGAETYPFIQLSVIPYSYLKKEHWAQDSVQKEILNKCLIKSEMNYTGGFTILK